jgi:hypothetical protein
MIHRFQYIVKKHIYCNGFINHGQFVLLGFKHTKYNLLTFFIDIHYW